MALSKTVKDVSVSTMTVWSLGTGYGSVWAFTGVVDVLRKGVNRKLAISKRLRYFFPFMVHNTDYSVMKDLYKTLPKDLNDDRGYLSQI